MNINTIQEANTALQPYVPLVSQLTGKDTTLTRIAPLMTVLGNPQDKLKVIHIAGTSGKTSTAYFLSALIKESGRQVGLTVSPHIDSVIERVQINGQLLDERTFCNELGAFLDIVEKVQQKPSYFELLYAFSIWVFVRHNVEYAVIETGMGGLYDATNVITRPDKICIITDIGIDHTHILGNDTKQIAAQKIGIVHDHNIVFMYKQDDEIMEVIQNWTNTHHASLVTTTQHDEEVSSDVDMHNVPYYQQRNWLLAYKTYRYLIERDRLPNLTSQALLDTIHLQVPAHMDIRTLGSKTIIMDGAHNAQKMTAFLDSFSKLYPNTKPVVLIALKHDKDFKEVTEILSPIASRVIATTFETSQDLPVQSMDPHELAAAFNNSIPTEVVPNQDEAYNVLLVSPEPVCIITGSFYLLSQLRNKKDLR